MVIEGVEQLAEDAGPDGGVVGGVGHAADEAAEVGFAGVGGVAAGVARLREDVAEEGGEAVEGGGGGERFGWLRGRGRVGLRYGVEADGGGLAEVHGEMAGWFSFCGAGVHGDGEEGVAVAELFVGEAGFFGAEEQSHFGGRIGLESLMDEAVCVSEGVERVLEDAVADGGSSEDQSAVGDGFGDGGGLGGGLEDAGGVDGGLFSGQRGFEGDGKVVDDAEVGEAEVVHGAGDGADVRGIAGADEDDVEAGLLLGEHEDMVRATAGAS
jgi:hypothetical protein